ncbi:unnamed protein product [Cercopithifilaria johnstoni]|uniref:PDZ domain-containing protein n=1 Tax=Cercopithifilaria johnstoni TaxID=2874296 RepID=A0A8J2Q503_9BILA|nr:unnamed protein product [Cercopithifilaria johnstoni]
MLGLNISYLFPLKFDNVLKSNSKFHNLLKYLENVLVPHVKQTEKLIFVGQEAQEISGLVVKCDEKGERLIIIGPKDIKKKSGGRIHIGDQILAFNQHFLHSLSSTRKSQTNFLPSISFIQDDDVSNQCKKINSCNTTNYYQLEGGGQSNNIGNIGKKERKESKSSLLNCSKFTKETNTTTTTTTTTTITENRRAKERGLTAVSNLVLVQVDDDDGNDDNDCEVSTKQDAIWKYDSENVTSSIPSTTLIDRYEKLIENFNDRRKVYDKSKKYKSIIIVTLLRQSPHMVLTSVWTEVEIIHLSNIPGVGLGFGIVGSASSGVVVKTILPGSVADKDKRLCPGDHILRICGINVNGMSPQQIATLLRRHGTLVELVVGRPAHTSDNCKESES